MEKILAPLPPQVDLETPAVLKALISAHRHLAELKGVAKTIPNEGMLISTLALQKAQSSSAIENIITTQDQLYKFQLHSDKVDRQVPLVITVNPHNVASPHNVVHISTNSGKA